MPDHHLYHVQDPDRPMHVLARSMEHALERWRELIRAENADDPCEEPIAPDGVAMIADSDDVLPPETKAECDQLRAALAFARSVILSGESWSSQCARVIDSALRLESEEAPDA